MRRAVLALVSLVALLSLGGSAAPPDDLDRFVTTQMARRRINGLSLAIVQNGKVITARAYGITDAGTSRRVDTTTLFQAGSISKPVAALGALRLVEQRRLDLDTDVNRVLTSWHLPPSPYTAEKPVTLRGLLSHTAGLTVHGFPGYDADSARPTLVQVLDGTPPANTAPIRNDTVPGARWKYSGGGYTIMQQMVIDVSGQPFPEYLRSAVLTPLGMARSSYEQPLPPDRAAHTAAGHYSDGKMVHRRWHVYPEMAAAGLWTTPSDLARFAIGVQQAYTGRSSAIISQDMAKQMLTEQQDMFGLGLALEGSGDSLIFFHNGRDEGFDAAMAGTAVTEQAYAIMINANDNSRFMSRLATFIERKYGWPGTPVYRAPAPVAIPAAQLEAATGLYDIGQGRFITLVARDGHLFTTVDGGLDEEFVPLDSIRFASLDNDVRLELQRDPSGTVAGITRVTPRGARTLPRLGPLFRSVRASGTTDPTLVARTDSVLRAMDRGGAALQSVGGVTEGVRRDFGALAWPPVAGFTNATFAGMSSVTGGNVVRHGGAVARVGYFRVRTASGERLIIVYYTADGAVTDVDVIDE